jgi:predicted membrane protein (TIGR00267 family)
VDREAAVNAIHWLFRREHLFPFVLGVTDGILTALTLGAGHLFSRTSQLSWNLGVRIAAASSFSGVFIFFTAEYARLRGELVRAERELNLAKHGHLATTQLGRTVFWDTIRSGLLSSLCNFVGALFPLAVGAFFSTPAWIPLIVALFTLGMLGIVIARVVHGQWARWSSVLMMAGGALTWIGVKLHIA